MGRIALITYGITSYLNAGFALARRLVDRGHHVTFVSSFDCGTAVQAQGFDFVLLSAENALRQDPEKLALERAGAVRRYLRRSAQLRVGRKLLHFARHSRELEETLQRLAPDVVLIDEELPEAVVVAAGLGYPTLLLQYFISTRRAPNVPPLHTGLLPGRSWWGRARVAAAWQRLLLLRRLKYAWAPRYFGGTDRRSLVRVLAARYGFDFDRRVRFDQWIPLTFPDLTTLHLTALELDFPGSPVDPAHIVGPQVALDRAEPVDDPAYRALLAALDAGRRDGPRPLIFASIGTFWLADPAYIRRLIAVFALRPEWDLVLAIGRTTTPDAFAPLPPNVTLVPGVPQIDFLRRTDVMLTHGGIATINECILLGVPLVVYSTGKIDQDGNAARVAYHNLGLRGDMRRESPAHIAAKIERALTDPAIAAAVGRMQAVFHAYRSADRALPIIERVM